MAWPVSQSFKSALVAPVRDVTMRVRSIDASFNPLQDITSPTAEGIVYVDTTRATRRTAQIRVINKDGLYTPKGSDYSNLGTNALFWWNKMFTIEYGVTISKGNVEYVPLGTFMVDRVEVLAEKGISVLNIDGSDLWKRFTFSEFTAPVAYAVGTSYNTIIGDAAAAVVSLD